jgi:hypothetical protein
LGDARFAVSGHVEAYASPVNARPMRALAALVMAATASACSMHMALPPEIGPGTEEVPVRGRSLAARDDCQVGEAWIEHVKREFESDKARGLVLSERVDETRFSFDVRSPAGALRAQCVDDMSRNSESLGRLGTAHQQSSTLACNLGAPGDAAPLELRMSASLDHSYEGTFQAHGVTYRIRGIDQTPSGSAGVVLGYRLDGNGFVGAVEVIGEGRAWLAKSLDAQSRADALAAFGALLVYVPSTSPTP